MAAFPVLLGETGIQGPGLGDQHYRHGFITALPEDFMMENKLQLIQTGVLNIALYRGTRVATRPVQGAKGVVWAVFTRD